MTPPPSDVSLGQEAATAPVAIGDLPRAAATLPATEKLDFRVFWYVVAESEELKSSVLGRKVLDERIAVFRDHTGRAVALQDRCLHRSAPLSKGWVEGGRLRCCYHGWVYDGSGRVVEVPSLAGDSDAIGECSARAYAVCERDGYVYVRLSDERVGEFEPFAMPYFGVKGWRHVRLVNHFNNNVTNCVENFVDIPHTAYVHARIFRSKRNEKLRAHVERKAGSVTVTYGNETRNLGLFSWFLNGSGHEITHRDAFHMPNVTCVEYVFDRRRHFIITSQSVPLSECETLVYTDLTYDYGPWNAIAGYFVKRVAQKIIDQDVEILAQQMDVIKKHGAHFAQTPADLIHVFIESIRREIQMGEDPRLLPEQSRDIEFWV